MRAWLVVAVLGLLTGGTWFLLRPGEPGASTTSPADLEGARPDSASPPPSLAPSPGRAAPPAAMASDDAGDGAAHERIDGTDGAAPAPVAGPRARLEGTVLDEAGRPVAGARVRATALGATGHERTGHVTTCGADGRFAFADLAPDIAYAVGAHSPLHGQGTATSLPLSAVGTVSVEVQLLPARFLDLVVRDAATEAPIAGAKGTGGPNPILLPGEVEPPAPESDAAGRLRIGPLPLDDVDISIHAEGYLPASRSIPAGAEGNIEVNLTRALSVSGRVLRPDGTPAAGATVSLRFGHDAMPILHTAGWLSTETDERGAFAFSGLPAVPVPLEAKFRPAASEGHAPPEPETGAADPEAGTSDCVIRLGSVGASRAGTLTLLVVDPDGHPVPRARILLRSPGWSMSTDLTDGRFVYDLPVASVASTVNVQISAARDAEGAALPLAAAQTDVSTPPFEATIRLERAEPIRGVVRGPDGAPVAGATVQLRPVSSPPSEEIVASEQTSDDGTFALVGGAHAPGRIVVLPTRGFLAPEPLDVRPGSTGVEIRMRAGATAVVTVLDADGIPVAGAQVRVRDEGPAASPGMRPDAGSDDTQATDGQGRARVVGLDAAHLYQLSVSSSSASSRWTTTERWAPADVTVRLARTLRVTGVVRDRSGRPVLTARVQAQVDGDVATHDVDGTGRFVVDGLPEGPVRLRAVPVSGGGNPGDPFDVSAADLGLVDPPPPPSGEADSARSQPDLDPWIPVRAGATDVTLTLDLGATLRVRVEGWSPEAATGTSPFASAGEAVLVPDGPPVSGAAHRASISDDGTVRFHRLDPQRTYTLWIAPVGDRSARKTGVRAGEDLRVRLEPGKTLSLRIVGPAPVERVSLTLVGCPLSVPWWNAVKADGLVDLRGYPPGRYTIAVRCSLGGAPYAGQVTIDAGSARVDVPVTPAPAEGR